MDNSNAGQRVLGARKTVRGQKDSLENLPSHGLHDGASCYVIEEQANYRYVQGSTLEPDGRFVVMPVGNKGRFVRESGLTGFAMLDEGTLSPRGDILAFKGYLSSNRVQFKLTEEGDAMYVGTVPRLAIVSGVAQLEFGNGMADLFLGIASQRLLFASTSASASGFASVSSMYQLMPGDRVFLGAAFSRIGAGKGSLRILLA